MSREKAPPSAWRRFRKRLRPLSNVLAGRLGPPLLRLWACTWRCRWHGELFLRGKSPTGTSQGIYTFWHQSLLSMVGLFRDSGNRVLVSTHGDGELITGVLERLGIRAVRGSSTRGGLQALREILRDTESRGDLGITPDGPRGPKYRFQSGAVYLASRTGMPLYPLAVVCERCRRLSTWDEFQLAHPFTRFVLRLGEPVFVPVDLSREQVEEYRQQMETRLRKLDTSTRQNFQQFFAEGKRRRDLPKLPDRALPDRDTEGLRSPTTEA